MIAFTPKLQERKRIHKDICHKNQQWTWRIAISYCLFFITAIFLIATVIFLLSRNTTTLVFCIFFSAGACIACVPFFIGISNKNSTKYKCALPYSSFANGSLVLNDNDLEYIFWRVGPHEPAAYSSPRAVFKDEDKFIYTISKNEIESLVIKDDICFLKGPGKVLMPEWADEDQTVKKSFKSFSFVMAFEQADVEQTIIAWRNK